MWVPWSELQPGLMRSPLLRTLQGSSCLDLNISIVLVRCSPELNMFQKCSNGWRVEKMHLKSNVWGNKKPSFKHLKEILDFHAPETGKGKGKGKAKAQAGGGSKKKAGPTNKKAGPSNSRQNDD